MQEKCPRHQIVPKYKLHKKERIKKKSFKLNLRYRWYRSLNTNWELVTQERSLIAEDSASQFSTGTTSEPAVWKQSALLG